MVEDVEEEGEEEEGEEEEEVNEEEEKVYLPFINSHNTNVSN